MLSRILIASFLFASVAPVAGATMSEPAEQPVQTIEKGSIAAKYQEAATKIIDAVMAENQAYERLEYLCTKIGHRLSGSTGLTKAINWAISVMIKDGQENVRPERVMVPVWFRGDESALITHPRVHPLTILGLGGSVGTTGKGITAGVVVVEHEDDFLWLDEEDKVRGKIVLYNNKMPEYDPETGSGYGTTVRFRSKGASMAAERKAVAVLVRSVTAHSLNTPHTGALRYDENLPKIPAAAITTEDAELIARLMKQGEAVSVHLSMNARMLPEAASANVVGELRGSTNPEEIVVIGGHIDSWDVGQGAHDDGGGCIIAIEAINVLRKLDMIPRRTIRVVLWTNEENGLRGGKAYAREHEKELPNHVVAIESDGGVFRPTGYSVDSSDPEKQSIGAQQVRDIMRLLSPLGPMKIATGFSGPDVGPMKQGGVMLMGHRVDGSKYFDYHHTAADTIDKVDPKELSENVASLATLAYILADMPNRLGTETESKKGATD